MCHPQEVPVPNWGRKFLDEAIPICEEYLESTKRDYEEYKKPGNWNYFKNKLRDYLIDRNIYEMNQTPKFPEPYGIKERDDFYKQISFSGILLLYCL